MTLGNSANPTVNQTKYTSTEETAKEILVESSGQYLSIVRTGGNLKLLFVAIFDYCELDCSAATLADFDY
jgi:hypothetical protein